MMHTNTSQGHITTVVKISKIKYKLIIGDWYNAHRKGEWDCQSKKS